VKVYTRTGDDGTTGLFGGGRVAKSHPRLHAYGTVDEANAAVGLARAALRADGLSAEALAHADALLDAVQHDLFVLGGDLAAPGETRYPVPRIEPAHTTALERAIDGLDADLPPLKHFILPGGTGGAAALHLARTVVRRAERLTVELAALDDVSEAAVHYLNRLSDLLFVLARWANARAGVADVEWVPVERRGAAAPAEWAPVAPPHGA
jgi:cob(I)alamin adenosyltransferase